MVAVWRRLCWPSISPEYGDSGSGGKLIIMVGEQRVRPLLLPEHFGVHFAIRLSSE